MKQTSPSAHVVCADSALLLREIADASFHAVVTDPPYGLSADPDMAEVLRHWLAGDDYQHRGGGFMGKDWDSFVPGPATWREVYRVLKPGGYALVFAGTRTVDLMGVSLRLAGFTIRDMKAWLHGQGFPKSLDASKAMDKAAGARREIVGTRTSAFGDTDESESGDGRNLWAKPATREVPLTGGAVSDAARQWEGWGTALKPAIEPIIVARKPLIGTLVQNLAAHGTGALNIDGCRVRHVETVHTPQSDPAKHRGVVGTDLGITRADADRFKDAQRESIERTNTMGRWPPNVLISHVEGCERVGTREVGTSDVVLGNAVQRTSTMLPVENGWNGNSLDNSKKNAPNSYGKETIEAWNCVEGCPVAELDRQSGRLQSGDGKSGQKVYENECGQFAGVHGGDTKNIPHTCFNDAGGASRFFPTFPDAADEDGGLDAQPFLYQAKPSRAEREAGCDCLPARTAPDTVHRDPESAGVQSPRAGAGRGAGVLRYWCSACDLPLAGGRAVTSCPVNPDGQHTPEARSTGGAVRNNHPTVKSVALMRWLVRLVAPPGGVVLDPFAGSGSTGVACVREGVDFVGVEREAVYVAIAEARIAHARGEPS